MSRTVTAMFDSRSEAEAARQRLTSSNIDADRVRIIDNSSTSSTDSYSTSGATGGEGQGFWASLKDMFVADEDRHTYGEGISRGSFLLTAEVDENEADQAISILEQSNSVDLDEREQSWRSEGWSGYSAGAGTGTGTFAGAGSTGFGTDADSGQSRMGTSAAMTDSMTGSTGDSFGSTNRSTTVAEEHIPIVEEQLKVGKREVNRGGARVRSYVREVPVHEQVSLREEHVSVERRPVEGGFQAGELNSGDVFQERNIEMTETAEEAVVAKEARVKEELVVRKTAEERVETVDDTVRRTEVDIDEGVTGSENRSALFGSGSSGSGGLNNATGTGVTGSGNARPSDLSDADTSGNLQDRSRGF
jgi:uncharacterized protein (TIGR02271 family)